MKVKIIKCRSSVHWYHEHIGKLFEIKHTEDNCYGDDAITLGNKKGSIKKIVK